jgi:myo-inositol-1(or 4)-monophosphatase
MNDSDSAQPLGLETTMVGWAQEAAAVCISHFRRNEGLTFKAGKEAVTAADLQIEELLRRRIAAAFPGDTIIGEELAPHQGTSGRTWQVDPIDGTLNFALGLPDFCTSLAVMEGPDVLAACVYQPLLKDAFTATRGHGARLNGKPVRVGARAPLGDAVVSFQCKKKGRLVRKPDRLQALFLETMKTRKAGAIALELAWVSCGAYDALIGSFGSAIQLYDVAAGILLVEEAGGRVTDHAGRPFREGAQDLVASNGLVHDELTGLYARF